MHPGPVRSLRADEPCELARTVLSYIIVADVTRMAALLSNNILPGLAGADLPEAQQKAYLEGHDADIPTDIAPAIPRQSREHDSEKSGPHSQTTFVDESLESTVPSAEDDEQEDPNIVYWSSPDDAANPQNWSASTKWTQIGILSALTFLTPLASSMFAPGVPELMREFNTSSSVLATLVVSIYVLGFAFGPLVIAPLSELYGRLWVYHICNLGFIAFTVACGRAQSMGELCVYRFLQGVWGVCPITIGGGTIADLMPPEKRGGAMSIWAMGPLLGPVVGPVCGGFLAEAKSWRWIFYVIAMCTALFAISAFFILRETYVPVLLERKAARLRKAANNPNLRSKLDNGLTPRQLFLRAIVRPTKMLFLSPICGLMSLYMAIVYGFLYLLFTTFTFVFEDNYNFSPSIVGLVYIGVGVGNFMGLAVLGATSDRLAKALALKDQKRDGGTGGDGKIKPEYRLPPLIYAGPLIPIGLIIYGWTAQYHMQWAVPIFGTLLVGIGLIACFMSINTYLVDTFHIYAASALAANTVLRSILGGVFPLFGLQMYAGLGLGWGNSLLAFVALAMCPIPWVFYNYGERIRTHPKWQVQF